jgi:DNA 3'-phosphatase
MSKQTTTGGSNTVKNDVVTKDANDETSHANTNNKKRQASLTNFFVNKKFKTSIAPSLEPTSTSNNDLGVTEQSSLTPIVPTSAQPSTKHTIPPWNVYKQAVIYRTHREKELTKRATINIAAFDLNDTLLKSLIPWPSRNDHYELWNASAITKLRALPSTYKIVVVTNQGAVKSAFAGKKAAHVKGLIEWLEHLVQRPMDCVMSTNKQSGYHKPSVNLWRAMQECCCANEQTIDIANSFYVGDSVGEDDPQGGVDAKLAENVSRETGVLLKFYTPDEYFGPSSYELRAQQKQSTDHSSRSIAGKETPAHVLKTRAALMSGYLQGPILLLLCGVQGSGKSTFAQKLSGWIHLSQDTIANGKPGKREMVETAAARALQDGKCVIIDRMHLDPTQREYFVNVAKAQHVPVHIAVFTPPRAVIERRVRDRKNHSAGVQGAEGAKLAMASMAGFVVPKYEEGFALISASGTENGAQSIADLYRTMSHSNAESTLPQTFPIGNDNNLLMPAIALGTMGMGRKSTNDIVSTAAKAGFKAFDTAPTYKNEDLIGEALMNTPSFLTVKVPKRAISPADVRKELESSLAALKRSRVDLLLLHWPCDVMAAGTLQIIWEEMEKCKVQGLVQAIGVCNFNVKALAVLLATCKIPPAVNQIERHPLLPQWDLVDFCARHDIQLQAHTPLGQGKADLLEHPAVQKVAASSGLSVAAVVLKWNLQQGVAVVPKCSSEEHMNDTLASWQSRLLVEDMRLLDDISDRKRFVEPFFMYGSEVYSWGEKVKK